MTLMVIIRYYNHRKNFRDFADVYDGVYTRELLCPPVYGGVYTGEHERSLVYDGVYTGEHNRSLVYGGVYTGCVY